MNKNICCRIFKEQIDLILQLPEHERATVLYQAILSAFNQFENQIDNQIDNQNENAYVSVSVIDNISLLSKTVYVLLSKNITCKEFSNNYGGRRINAGRPKAKTTETPATTQKPQNTFTPPTEDEVLEYARQQNDMAGVGGYAITEESAHDFYDYYAGIGWVLPNDARTPIRDWKRFLSKWARNPKFKPKRDPDTIDIDDPEHFVI